MGRYTTGGIGRDVLAGAVAGGAAVWLISKMDWSLSHAGPKPGDSGVTPTTGAAPATVAATRAAQAAGVRLDEKQTTAVNRTANYGLGIGIGALYGLLRGMAPSVTTGRGSLYGIANFVLGDELGAPAMGLAKGPLEYSARDHGRSALAHIVFGLLTDLGTRLLSPWKNEVVILHGPSLQERIEGGRQALADGRDYLQEHGRTYYDRGRELAGEYAEQARDYADQARDQVDEWDLPGLAATGRKRARRFAADLRSHLPDQDDVMDRVDSGRKRARGWARDVGSRLPDRDDVEDAVDSGRSRARGWARGFGNRLPDRDDVADAVDTGRSKARGWFRSAVDRLPERDDVEDAVDTASRRGRKMAKRAGKRMPDRDDLEDTLNDGRKRVRRLADDARDTGSSGFDRAMRWLFG